MEVPKEEREKGTQNLFEKIMIKSIPNMKKEMYIQIHEGQRTTTRMYHRGTHQDIPNCEKINKNEKLQKEQKRSNILHSSELS
jgi:hypothetical protein